MRSIDFMQRAVALARPHRPHPNPRVGSVVVDAAGGIVGEGAHERPGRPHAERSALDMAGEAARGGTVYVTLEPCAHRGRTPPCTEALIEAGVARVVAAVADPDRRVAGRGFERLRAAGIEVEVGVGESAVLQLDPGYFHHRRTGRPLVTVKAVLDDDGRMAPAGEWSDPELHRSLAQLRESMDAVLVGAGTALAGDRSFDLPPDVAHRPRVVIVAGRRRIPPGCRLLRQGGRIIAPGEGDQTGHRVDLAAALVRLADEGALDVLVEGGPTLIAGVAASGLADRLVLYYLDPTGLTPAEDAVLPRLQGPLAGIVDGATVEDLSKVGAGIRAEIHLITERTNRTGH